MSQDIIKLFCFDLNWSRFDGPAPCAAPSAAQDWAFLDPQAYFDLHRAMGNNVQFCQAYVHGGYALYPTKLGPVAPGPGRDFLPRLFELSQKAGMPFWSYFCVGTDVTLTHCRPQWLVPNSKKYTAHGFFGPETPWTDLLCERVREFLSQYPADWILFDWFVYGDLRPDHFRVEPCWFMREPFAEIIGREAPASAEEITAEENLKYKREILARQFHRLQAAVREASPRTKIIFNVPYWEAAEPLWIDHPMLNESDGLFAECSNDSVVEWLLSIRKPHQRVMTTVIGRLDEGACDPSTWRKWSERGCDLFGYAWGTPPVMATHPSYAEGLDVIRRAFHEIG